MSKQTDALQTGREEKRARFAQEGGGKNNSVKLLALAAVLLVGVAAYVVAGRGGGGGAAAPAVDAGGGGALEVANGEVSVPVSELSGKARFYEYKTASGKGVRFFAMRSSDGVYRAALDSCDVCFAAKKGYRQEGDDMVCNKCGNHFHSAQVNEVRGGCNPVGLERRVEGGRLRLSARDLEAGAGYF